MDRREFIKVSGAGALTLFLTGCGLNILGSDAAGTAKTANAATTATPGQVGSGKKMKIVVLASSPHRDGTSAHLADKFCEGAAAAGHEIFRFNPAFEDIHPCLGCNQCGMAGPCVQKDALENTLMPKLLESDLIVLVTPIYYYTFSAQLKTVIDRFYSRTGALHNKKAMLMATAYNSADYTMESLYEYYQTLCRYMEWENVGAVLAKGCGSRSLIERSEFPGQAYTLGQSL